MGWGDELMAAGEAARWHREDPCADVPVEIRGLDGKARWHPAWEGLDFILRPDDPRRFRHRKVLVNGQNARPYCEPLTREGGWIWRPWRARDNPPVIALNDKERSLGLALAARLGRYAVIEPCGDLAGTRNKLWGLHRWIAVAQVLDRTGIRVVQVGPPNTGKFESGGYGIPGIEFHPTRDFRAAAGVISGAALYLGNEGGLVHAARALGVPSVVVWGGCTSVEHLGYPENVNLVSDLPGSPCGRYLPCEHCNAAMEGINPAHVIEAARGVLAQRQAGAA